MLGTIIFIALAQIAVAQSIQGVVVRDASGDPLSKARVELRGGQVQQTTTTENDGRFYFRNLPAGAYEISIRRDGFTPAEYGQKWPGGPGVPLQLRSGQPLPDLTVRMVAAASISGRIADSNGQPMANAQVQALKSTFQGELRILLPVQQVRTTATGDFRLYGLPAGRYFVNVIAPGYSANSQLLVNNGGRTDQGAPYQMSAQARQILGQSVITASQNSQDAGPIYFPSTPYIQNAAPIDLRPGAEYKGVDLQMAPVRRFTVCGTVRGIPPRDRRAQLNPGGPVPPPPPPPPANRPLPPVSNAPNPNDPCDMGTSAIQDPAGTAQLAPLDVELRAALNSQGNRYNATVDGVTGRFVIRNVLPGLYNLATFISNADAATTVDLRNRDVTTANLDLSPGYPLQVKVTIEGNPPGTPLPGQMTILIGSSPPTQGTSPNQPVDPATGLATVTNVGTDDTRLYVLPILTTPVAPLLNIPDSLQGLYVKSAKLGGVDVLNTGFRFAGEDKVMEIVLGKNAGSLAGRVVDERRQPAAAVFVTLVPEVQTARLYRTDMYKTTSTDAEGRFEIKNLPPGDYKVFALEGFEKDSWVDPDFFKPYEDRGLSVKVGEGRVFTLEAPVTSIRQQ